MRARAGNSGVDNDNEELYTDGPEADAPPLVLLIIDYSINWYELFRKKRLSTGRRIQARDGSVAWWAWCFLNCGALVRNRSRLATLSNPILLIFDFAECRWSRRGGSTWT